MSRLCFVVLHYLNLKMTTACIKTLEKSMGQSDYHIIVVDNGSPNGSGARLQKNFRQHSHCTVLLNDQNEGFARGNNLGYAYAREHFDPDYIAVINSDIFVEDPLFLQKLDQLYRETGFCVYGPDIYAALMKVHQNPPPFHDEDREAVLAHLQRVQKMLKKPRELYNKKQRKNERIFRKKWFKALFCGQPLPLRKTSFARQTPAAQHQNPMLHGACLVFSRDFIQREALCFNPATFLCYEENFLYHHCERMGYRRIYDPLIRVTHMEHASAHMLHKNAYDRRQNKNKHIQNSLHAYLAMLDEEESQPEQKS